MSYIGNDINTVYEQFDSCHNERTILMNSVSEKIVYDVTDIKKLLGIGKNQAYELVKSGVFPTKRVGSRYLVAKDIFCRWLLSGDEKVA